MVPPRQRAREFFFTFLALMLLLALTVEAARHDLGRWNFAVATLIAACKAVLIILFFMNLRRSIEITKLVVCAGFFWLAIMFTLALADYWTRSWLIDEQQLSYNEPRRPAMTSLDVRRAAARTRLNSALQAPAKLGSLPAAVRSANATTRFLPVRLDRSPADHGLWPSA